MAIEKSEMNGCWDLNPIREGFYYLKKSFLWFFIKQKPLNLKIRKTLKV
jgi:hypothetical protein